MKRLKPDRPENYIFHILLSIASSLETLEKSREFRESTEMTDFETIREFEYFQE